MALTWRRTWEDQPRDWSARDPEHPDAFIRIYWSDPPESRRDRGWLWIVSDHGVRGTGFAATAKDAGFAARKVWAETVAGKAG